MKTIVQDPEEFFANGGWKFLETESDVRRESFATFRLTFCLAG